MAGHAAVDLNSPVALLLRVRQRVPLTAQIAIETSIGRHKDRSKVARAANTLAVSGLRGKRC